MNVKVVGLGGIGSILADKLARYLNYTLTEGQRPNMMLVDGDSYEEKNRERQEFTRMGNKAESKTVELSNRFRNITTESVTSYIDENNVDRIVSDGDYIFIAVDNHKTRKIISDYAASKKVKDVVLISGGNELTDGNVQRYIKRGGVNITPRLTDYHPEIANPEDKLPTEMSCEELMHSVPQLYFTNLSVATAMCQMFYNTMTGGDESVSEVYFDMKTMKSDAKKRAVLK